MLLKTSVVSVPSCSKRRSQLVLRFGFIQEMQVVVSQNRFLLFIFVCSLCFTGCGDGLIHTTERTLSEHGDKIEESEKSQIEADVAALKEAMAGEDLAEIKAKTEALGQSSMKLGEAMYKAQEEAAGEAGPAEEPQADDSSAAQEDVVDADFEEVDDDKKGQA